MTRGELVAELLGVWEESVIKLEREGHHTAADEVKAAISVLEKTYTMGELMPSTPDRSYNPHCD